MPDAPVPAPAAGLLATIRGLNLPLYVSAVALVVAGVVLDLKGQSVAGNTLIVAGAAELGVKVAL